MKTYKKLIILALGFLMLNACNQNYIDEISKVDPGTDASDPVISVVAPTEGYEIKVPDLVASINIQVEVTDDIELKSVTVLMDGNEDTTFTVFKDYRRLLAEYVYDKVTNGEHVLTVNATDLEGKVSTKSVSFAKVSPYTPKFPGEIFYMPFEGDYMEMISFQYATKVGNPGFSTGGIQDGKAYAGATDSYITFPLTNLKNTEFSAAFWYKVNPSPDRSGIINVSPAGEDRKFGFRLFREGDATSQRIKLNVGAGAGETWNDGDVIDATSSDWVHLAFTISGSSAVIYINGAVAREVANTGIDWTGCDVLSIGSGAPNFTYWDHKADLSQYDELRIFDKALSSSEIQNIIYNDSPYEPKYNGEVFYMPFEGNSKDLVSGTEAGVAGSPGYQEGKAGQAYSGATGAYLTFPAAGLKSDEFSAVFWMKVNPDPTRAGILSVGASADSRNEGFRLFREGDATSQRIKLNVGTGAGESWNDGGLIDVTTSDWVHVAITISQSKNTIYFNGEEIRSSDMTGFDWTGCETLTIGSGGETFSYWDHLSDLSLFDELRMFDKALTQAEIQTIFDAEN